MSAARDIIAALVAAGMDAIDAAALMTRAAVEMATGGDRKSSGASRQQRYRERNKASQSVTEVTPERPEKGVTERNESVTVTSPVTLSLSIEEKKEERIDLKKDRPAKKRVTPLPIDWIPPESSFALAAEHGTTVPFVEAVFRDYLKSSGKLYADYNAAFCNFVRNQRKFNGGHNGQRTFGPTSKSAGADFLAGMSSLAADIDGHREPPRPAEPEIPLGRFNIDG